MKCTYEYQGTQYKTYKDLFIKLLEEVNSNETDIVFSVDLNEEGDKLTPIQKSLKQSFEGVKNRNKIEINKIYTSFGNDGDPVADINPSNLHITALMDDQRFKDSNGRLYTPKIEKDNFIQNQARILRMKDPDLSEEESLRLAESEFQSYEKKKFDAYIIHAICRRYFSEITKDDIRATIINLKDLNSSNSKFIDRANYIMNNDNILEQIKNIYFEMRKIDIQNGSTVLYDIPIQREIMLDDQKVKIYDTIDKVIIYANGHVDLVKYKITEDNPAVWPNSIGDSKVEKYRFELAFIKTILEDQGISFKDNVNLKIGAIQLNYDHEDPANLLITDINPKPFNLQMDVVDGQYKMSKYISVARNIIQPEIRIEDCDAAIEKVNFELNQIFPEKGIKLKSQMITIDQWIKDNPDKIHKIPQVPGGDNKYKYELFLGKEHIFISEDSDPENNSEMKEYIEQFLKDKERGNQIVVNTLQTAIEQATIDGYIKESNLKAFLDSADNLKDILDPYFTKETNSEGKEVPIWKCIKNSVLSEYNILLFQNNKTGQLDIINVTNLNLNTKIKFNKGNNLAGHYLMDLDARLPDASYGLISGIQIVSLLNQLISTIKNPKLGTMKIISTINGGVSQNYNIETFINKIYKPLINIVNNNINSDQKIQIKLSNNDFIDEYQTIYDELKNILNSNRSFLLVEETEQKFRLQAENIVGNYTTTSEKRLKQMEDLLHTFEGFYKSSTAEELADKLKESGESGRRVLKLIKNIYEYVSKAKNREVSQSETVDSLLKKFTKPRNIKSHNFTVTLNTWAEYRTRINTEAYNVGKEIDKIVTDLYKAAGYTELQNRTFGGQISVFKNMFEDGDLMKFKDPYDDKNDLLNYERTFLKQALLIFAKHRYKNLGYEFNITDPDSKECLDFIKHNSIWYFNCPLQKTSNSSALQTGYTFKQAADKIEQLMKDPKVWLDERLDKASLDEYIRSKYANNIDDITKLQVQNYFNYGEADNTSNETCNSTRRLKLLSEHENKNYFEHNIENLLRDFTFESVRTENIKAFMFDTKLQLLVINLIGKEQKNLNEFKDEIDLIKEFIKINVFHMPTMSKTEQSLARVVIPLKRLITNLFIPGNLGGMARDINEGFSQSICRALTKVGTDISAKDVISAYGIVTKDTISNPRMASLVHQLCIKYQLSNIDVSNPAEGQKTERGIVNFENFMYQTMKRPDFLNRMVLFVAQCKHDGVWEALSSDEYGNIHYDWKKDKRFNLLASNDKRNINEYNKQKSLFYSLIRQWNIDHPNNQTKDYTELPMPYSELEVRRNKDLSDNIYGAYDRSTKAMGEFGLLMMTFGNFTTWMNGQIENYYKQAGPDKSKFTWEQATDNSGNLLYFTEDGLGVTTENTGYIVYNQIPIWTQGIIQTLNQMGKAIFKSENTIKDVMSNRVNQENMNKLITDISMTLLYYLFIKVLLQTLRKEQKEKTDPQNVFTNAICEIMYKGLYNSWDGFKGPLNVFQYLGEQTNPPIYTEGIAIAKDLFKCVSGDMNLISFGSRHIAPLRSVRETIKASVDDKQPPTR